MRPRSNPSTEKTWPKSFKAAFCERFHCPPDRYESAAFWRGVVRHALPVALVIQWLKPDFFAEDMELIREVGEMTSPGLFKSEVNYFYGRNLRHKSWLRRTFRIRVSGGRMLRIRRQVQS